MRAQVLASVADTVVLCLSIASPSLPTAENTKISFYRRVESSFITSTWRVYPENAEEGGADVGLCVRVRGRIGLRQIGPHTLSKRIAAFGVFRLGVRSLSLQS